MNVRTGGPARRILFLSDVYPWPLDNGYRQRVYHLLRGLCAQHEVTLATFFPHEEATPPPGLRCRDLVVLSDRGCAHHRLNFRRWATVAERVWILTRSLRPGLVQAWRSREILHVLGRLRHSGGFDVVWSERPFLADMARAAGFQRIVVDLPDIETVSYQRALRADGWYASKPLHLLELAKLWTFEQAMPLRFWRLVTCKDSDRKFFRLGRHKVQTLPNGVEDFPEAADPGRMTGGDLLFVGALDFESNIDAVSLFATAVMPLIRRSHPAARFIVIGRNPVPAARRLAEDGMCEIVTDATDLSPYFDDAAVVVAPIRLGSGTRLKVLEAMARGKAVVATSVAAEGLDVRAGVDLEIADSPEDIAAACRRLLSDPVARKHLGAAGRARVLEHYRWTELSKRIEAVLDGAAIASGTARDTRRLAATVR